MGDNGAGRPAARAITPPPVPSNGDVSGARLAAAAQPDSVPTMPVHPADASWALGTAPTLLLKAVDANGEEAISTARIPTPAPMALEEQPWFKTGTTVPPPSRPSSESIMPAPRNPPNPRVRKIVFGVFGACLFIVALAGVKLVFKRTANAESSQPKVAIAAPAQLPPAAQENTPPAEPPKAAPEPAPPPDEATAAASSEAAQRGTTPARTSATPARTTTKTTTRRAPAPKKPVRGAH